MLKLRKRRYNMGYIYKITNTITGGIYIGQTTKTLEERFRNHIRDVSKVGNKKFKSYPLYRDMKTYGKNNFVIEPVKYVENNEQLNDLEIFYIKLFDSYRPNNKNNYNLTKGGFFIPPTKFRVYKLKYRLIKVNKNNQKIEKIYTDRNELLKDYKRKQLDSIHKVIAGENKSAYGFYWYTPDKKQNEHDFIKYKKGKKIYYKNKKVIKVVFL
jgi:group I intron endonuclease